MKKLNKLVNPSFQTIEAFAACDISCYCGCHCPVCPGCQGLSSERSLPVSLPTDASGVGSTVSSGKYNQMMSA